MIIRRRTGNGDVAISAPVLDLDINLRRLLQHCRNWAILLFGQTHGVFHRLVSDIPAYAVNQANTGIDLGESFGALGSGAHFQTSEGLALLAEDTHNVAGRAGA